MKILLLTKTTKHCYYIQKTVKRKFGKTTIISGERGQPLPTVRWQGDYLISFLSPWIIPEIWLKRAKVAINFHPGPPKYPGIGGYNFAIYNKEKEYGVTCHHMVPRVDSGKIIKVIKFPMSKTDIVLSLKNKTMKFLVKLFEEIWQNIVLKKPLSEAKEKWLRKPYSRKDLQALCKITKNMSKEEIRLRIKATYFTGAEDLPFIELFGNKFVFTLQK